MIYQPVVRAPGDEELTLAKHAGTIDAIASGKPQQAERTVREHLTQADALHRQLNDMTGATAATVAAAT